MKYNILHVSGNGNVYAKSIRKNTTQNLMHFLQQSETPSISSCVTSHKSTGKSNNELLGPLKINSGARRICKIG